MTKFWFITLSFLLQIAIVSAQGVAFQDIFSVFKTGFVDSIAGSWLLAGLMLAGISLWIGISLGFSVTSILVIFLPISLTLVATSVLPPTLSFIIAVVITIFMYLIYTRLFKR